MPAICTRAVIICEAGICLKPIELPDQPFDGDGRTCHRRFADDNLFRSDGGPRCRPAYHQ